MSLSAPEWNVQGFANTSIPYFCYLLNTNSTDLVNRLKRVLTHSSYKKKWNLKIEDSSRYTFLGMYAFRGLTADHLSNFKPGSGQQLQHTLGNIFSQTKLHQLFDEWKLKRYVRVAPDFELEKHKHVFVYAVMGYFYGCLDSGKLVQFMNRYLIDMTGLNEHTGIKHNIRAQLDFLSMQVYKKKPKIIPLKKQEGYNVKIIVGDEVVLAEQLSKSLHYARKNAITKALKKLVADNQVDFSSKPDVMVLFESKLKQKRLEEKSVAMQEHEDWLKRQAERKENRQKAKLERIEERRIIEEKRRKAKLERKRRIEQRARMLAEKSNRPMNAAKRRFLEDKAK